MESGGTSFRAFWIDPLVCLTLATSSPKPARAGPVVSKSIRVGDACWIGARAILLPGVTVGDGCVIAAGAVVTKDCDAHGLYTGVPAVRVQDLAA